MFLRQPRFTIPPKILAQARGSGAVPTAVVGAAHPLAMRSAFEAANLGLIEPVLVGPRENITDLAADIGWSLQGVEIADAADDAATVAISTRLAREGAVSVLMKGYVQTDTLMAAVVNADTGLRTERRITHAFYLTTPDDDGGLVVTDAAVNIAPSVDVKVDIAMNAVEMLNRLGNRRPRVAILSGTEKLNRRMPSSLEAAEVAKRLEETMDQRCYATGPLAMDVAISPSAAQTKGLADPVSGHADILVVPTLEAGNILYKSLVYAIGATAAGIVVGAQVPIVLTSRADPPEARVTALALACQVASAVD